MEGPQPRHVPQHQAALLGGRVRAALAGQAAPDPYVPRARQLPFQEGAHRHAAVHVAVVVDGHVQERGSGARAGGVEAAEEGGLAAALRPDGHEERWRARPVVDVLAQRIEVNDGRRWQWWSVAAVRGGCCCAGPGAGSVVAVVAPPPQPWWRCSWVRGKEARLPRLLPCMGCDCCCRCCCCQQEQESSHSMAAGGRHASGCGHVTLPAWRCGGVRRWLAGEREHVQSSDRATPIGESIPILPTQSIKRDTYRARGWSGGRPDALLLWLACLCSSLTCSPASRQAARGVTGQKARRRFQFLSPHHLRSRARICVA